MAACYRSVARFDSKLAAALGAVWFIWGSTFAGMRYAVASIPPFIMAGTRFFVAGALLYAVCAARGRWRVTQTDLTRAFISGTALLLLGNGMTAYTVQYLPTGINALLLSSTPFWMAIIAFVWGGERPRRVAVAGMTVGMVGLILLVLPHTGGALPLWPATLAIAASIAWAFGSVYQRRIGKASDVMRATALQMLAGGTLIGIEAAATGEWRTFDLHAVSVASLMGLAWLIVFGAIIAYSAYQYTMHAANIALASTYAYVNPIVALSLGYVLFGERLSPLQLGASAVIVAGVALMMWPLPAVASPARSKRAAGQTATL